MKRKFLILLFFIIVSCKGIRNVADNSKLDYNNPSVSAVLKKYNANQENTKLLFFTSGFDKDLLEIVEDEKILYKDEITTFDQLSLATIQTISTKNNCLIKLNGSRLKFRADYLKKYKFLYIGKGTKLEIRYSNIPKKIR